MATLTPFCGIRFNTEHVRLGGVLAPPYDVISPQQLEELYARDLRNIVRIDFGRQYPDDRDGEEDRYTRADAFLESWLLLQILIQDREPSLYVSDHEFTDPNDGSVRHRRGIFGTLAAVPWDRSELRPHERTLSAPKADRLALLRATGVHTSAVFAVWAGAGDVDAVLDEITSRPPLQGGRTPGEFGSEKLLLWRVAKDVATRLQRALQPARLYVADGHHRYETAVAYAEERRRDDPRAPAGSPFERCLVYLSDSSDPGLTILPTHRLLRPGRDAAFSIDDLWARLDDAWEVLPAASVAAAFADSGGMRETHHAFAVVDERGAAVLRRLRGEATSPRDSLDVVVLQEEVLAPAGATPEAVAEGALGFTRDLAELEASVQRGDALLGFGVQPVSPAELIAVADAGETMPQKSTYFYPKVPTGLVLAPT
ncbi:MAG TPA: DUF1015 domain-containing protein [Dehalococcoidia bacterium]|nr:DUF1015 domain-containing protein [Dehalococcoidia bacterium]